MPESGHVKIPVFQKIHFWHLQVMQHFRVQIFPHTNTVQDLLLPSNNLLRGQSLKKDFQACFSSSSAFSP